LRGLETTDEGDTDESNASVLIITFSKKELTMLEGVVQSFDEEKGTGFILGDDGRRYFLHHERIKPEDFLKIMSKGQRVNFGFGKGPKGFYATNVKVAG
jgi:CspA family cold shock protein